MAETRGLCLSEEQTIPTVGNFSIVFKTVHFSCKDMYIELDIYN